MNRDAALLAKFPLTAKYDPQWVRENALGENTLCQVESLARHMPFSPKMRVLEPCARFIAPRPISRRRDSPRSVKWL